jgi:hypothetical protein
MQITPHTHVRRLYGKLGTGNFQFDREIVSDMIFNSFASAVKRGVGELETIR